MKSKAKRDIKTSVNGRAAPKTELGAARGQMKAFTRAEVVMIDDLLSRESGRRAIRDRALFAVAIDTMLRGSDMIRIRVEDVKPGSRMSVVDDFVLRQKKTNAPIHCNLTHSTRLKLEAWLDIAWQDRRDSYSPYYYVFAICDRQYRTIIKNLAKMIKLDPARYSGHSTRRTMSTRIYAQTKNLAAVRVLLGHKSLGATAAYLGIEQADANAVWKQVTSSD